MKRKLYADTKRPRVDWSPRRFYLSMRRLFRLNRNDLDDLIRPPFYLNRPLSYEEFRGSQREYIYAKFREYRKRCERAKVNVPATSPKVDRWPDVTAYGVKPQDYWKYERPLGRMYFALTKDEQRQAKRDVKALAQRGPRRLRPALSQAAKRTPQVRRTISPIEVTLHLVTYRAECEFLWTFLRSESGLDRADKKEPQEVQAVANELAKSYPYLHLKSHVIVKGLVDSYQADKDAAEEFGISPKTVRSLISKQSRRRS